MLELDGLSRREFLGIIGVAALGQALSGCGSSGTETSASSSGSGASSSDSSTASGSVQGSGSNSTDTTSAAVTDYSHGTHHATIKVKDYGTMEVLLDADTAPISVNNFCTLANEGFYNGLTFHRIIDGFMIQGGDPNGDGTGGSGTTIKGEFSANGVENNLMHTRGAISMARSSDYDSASSQFFIMQKANNSLDGYYAVFGHLTSGIEIVDDICEKVPVTDDNGTVAPADQPVITAITIVE